MAMKFVCLFGVVVVALAFGVFGLVFDKWIWDY